MRYFAFSMLFLAVLIVTVQPTAADRIAELDLDGVIGNGPDTIDVAPGALFEVEAWISEGCGLNSIVLVFCDDGYLEFVDAEHNCVPAWTCDPPDTTLFPGCVHMFAADFTFGCVGFFPPRRFATLTQIISELLNPPGDDREIRLHACSVLGQGLFYLRSRHMLPRIQPDLELDREGLEQLTRHITEFSLAAIEARNSRASQTDSQR